MDYILINQPISSIFSLGTLIANNRLSICKKKTKALALVSISAV
jgi:hypothetical protein